MVFLLMQNEPHTTKGNGEQSLEKLSSNAFLRRKSFPALLGTVSGFRFTAAELFFPVLSPLRKKIAQEGEKMMVSFPFYSSEVQGSLSVKWDREPISWICDSSLSSFPRDLSNPFPLSTPFPPALTVPSQSCSLRSLPFSDCSLLTALAFSPTRD